MKTSYVSLICAGLLLLPGLYQRAQETVIEDQTDEQSGQTGVVSSDSIETSGTVTAKAGADVLFGVPLQAELSLGSEGEQAATVGEVGGGGNLSGSLTGDMEAPATIDAVLLVLDGDGQTAPAGSFNANPFDIAVWHGSGSAPLAGQSVTFTVEQGGGLLLSETTATASGSSSLTLASDDDGTVQAYYQHGAIPGVLSSIRVDAVGQSLTLQSLSTGDGDGAITGGFGKSPAQQILGTSAPMGAGGGSGPMGAPGSGVGGGGNLTEICPDCGGTCWVQVAGEADQQICPGCGGTGWVDVVPQGFKAAALSTSAIKLDWTAVKEADATYELERKTENTDFVKITDIAAGGTSYTDTGLAASTTYIYRLRAADGGLYSAYTQEASATTGSVDGAGGTGGSGGLGGGADASGFAAWALAHGLNPNTPYADSDGNGICDLEEYLMSQNADISGSPVAGFEIFSPMGDSVITVAQNTPAPASVLLTPAMTSDTTPAPYRVVYGGQYSTIWPASGVFDQGTKFWESLRNFSNYMDVSGQAWVGIDMPAPKVVKYYDITNRYTGTPPGDLMQMATDWKLQGSNNPDDLYSPATSNTWVTIDDVVNFPQPTAMNQTFRREIPSNTTAYRYYRIKVMRIRNDSGGTTLGELKLYGY